jgi:succinate dehydrogenase/fumarate reductase flavoprotein subunit
MKKREIQKGLSRRDFLKGAAIGAGAAVLCGLAPKASGASQLPQRWDEEADVVVVGYGAAGSAAAMVAQEAGAKVLILEKHEAGGGSTCMSGGFFVSPSDAEGAVDYLLACAQAGDGMSFDLDRAMLSAWAEEAVRNADWIKSIGGEVGVFIPSGWYREFKGAESYKSWGPTKTPFGRGLWQILSGAVAARGIAVAYGTSVKELLLNEKGEVAGVMGESGGREFAIRARKATILTCGSFDHNETMKKNYLKVYPQYSVGHLGNTGDAITLAAKVGAALWHMNAASCTLCHKFPEIPAAFVSGILYFAKHRSVILVNKYGDRFVNEALPYDAVCKALEWFDPMKRDFPSIPCWCIFDEKARIQGSAGFSLQLGTVVYKWSRDNREEIDKGWIIQADTLRDLSDRTGMDPPRLENAVRIYNDYAKSGKDPVLGREKPILIEGPPFFGLKGYPGLFSTCGGPRINEKAQVMDVRARIVPRLYAAGGASTFAAAFLYPLSGTMIGDAFAMGRIAGRNAAGESPWDR